MENQKFKYRGVITFLTKEAVSPQHIHERLVNVYQDQSPSVGVTTNEVCDSVEKLVMDDRRIKTREIAGAMGISKGTVQKILHYKHGLSKVCARWVPRMMSAVQRADRVDMSRAHLDLINGGAANFYLRVVTGDETWLHHYDPESKQQSMQ